MNYPILFNKVLAVDGSYFLHRMLSQPNQWDMQTIQGKRTGGIYGCIRSIFKEMQKYNYFPVVVFDGGLAPRRLGVYPNYKRNEEKQLLTESLETEKTEQQILDEAFMREYRTQRKDIIEILHGFGIPCIRIENWEGDDLLYILSKISKDSIVVTDDRDLIQVVTENADRKCRVWRTMNEEMWDTETLKQKGLDAWEYINCKAISGDASDNIPGVCEGVSTGTALGLFKILESKKPFPTNDTELKDICKELGISKRTAYLNYKPEQFDINMQLMNLQLVDNDITDVFIDSLYNEILEERNLSDFNLVATKMNELEIYSIDIQGIFNRVKKLQNYLKIEDEDKVSQSSEETISRLF